MGTDYSALPDLVRAAEATLKDGTKASVKQCPYCEATEPRSGDQCGCGATVFPKPKAKGKDYRFARLQGVILQGHDLRNADFTEARMQGAILQGADLRGACFKNARMQGCILQGALTEGADFTGARMQGVIR